MYDIHTTLNYRTKVDAYKAIDDNVDENNVVELMGVSESIESLIEKRYTDIFDTWESVMFFYINATKEIPNEVNNAVYAVSEYQTCNTSDEMMYNVVKRTLYEVIDNHVMKILGLEEEEM